MKVIVPEYEFSAEELNKAQCLAAATGLEEETAQILFARGIDDTAKVARFMHPSKDNFLSPFLMSGMQELADKIKILKENGGEIVVFGDYDADGICAATIMHYALKEYGVKARIYVPERTDGYGLSRAGIDAIFAEGKPDLFITVDCGVSCKDEVEYIKSFGVEVIITDHHELPEILPDCTVINPKNHDDYPYDNLCGAGVAFKVACAILGEKAYDFLDFAALATVADSVPLINENRDIVTEGLKLFNAHNQTCFTYLLGKTNDEITAQTLSYTIAPRVNAAGRMGDSHAAYELFTSEDEERKYELAAKLCLYNSERQKRCDELYSLAKESLVKKGAYSHVIMLMGEDWNAGFLGIVAAKIAEEYNRPTLIFVNHDGMLRGSARSIEKINIFNALKSCSEYLEEFGGHAQAAGVNLKAENFDALEKALDKEIAAHYTGKDFVKCIPVAAEMTEGFSSKFIRELTMLEPYGVGHRKPLFSVNLTECNAKEMKPASPHLNIKNDTLELVYFSGAKHLPVIASDVKKTFVFEINVSKFKGREYVKGFVRDFIYDARTEKDADFSAFSAAMDRYFDKEATAISPIPLSAEETKSLILEKQKASDWGLCLIASGVDTLKNYPYLDDLPCDLYCPSSHNVGNTLLTCPLPDADLSGYDTIVFLDMPLVFTLRLSAEKKVYYNKDVGSESALSGISTGRETLANIFMTLRKNVAVLQGNSPDTLIKRCGTFGYDKKEFLFAVRVFEELGILDFSFGVPTLYRDIKTELAKSTLYQKVQEINSRAN